MIEGLKPYLEYKESRLPWVGAVPSHWELVPNRAIVSRRKVLVGNRHSDYQLLSLSKAGVIVRDLTGQKGKFSADMGTSQEVRKGDLVFCLFDVPETPRTVGLSQHDGMITGAYTVFECRSESVPFFEAFYRSMDDRKLLSPLYSGLRNTIPPSRFLGTKTPQPPPDEQEAIIGFINHANTKIERAIQAKKKLIALLNEKKQAIIHRAVTRGLDCSVPLKPSGVPWLGEIPQHWETVPLKYLCRKIQNGATPPTSEPRYYQDGTVAWFGPSSIGKDLTVGAPVKYLTTAAFNDGKARLMEGPALLVIVIGATAGKITLLPGRGATNQQITAFELREGKVLPEFCTHQLRAAEVWLRSTASTATIPILDSGIVNRLPVAFPSVPEQEIILSDTLTATETLTRAIERAEREIELLREYRTRLTADVVTGKLDVRDAARNLPETGEAIPIAIDDEELEAEIEEAKEEAA